MTRITIFIFVLAAALAVPAAAVRGYTIDVSPAATSSGESIGEYINRIYNSALGLGGIAALIMITIGAILFSISGAINKKQLGKEYIIGAITGLILLFGAFIILRTINPQLTELSEPAASEYKGDEYEWETLQESGNCINFECEYKTEENIDIDESCEELCEGGIIEKAPIVSCETACKTITITAKKVIYKWPYYQLSEESGYLEPHPNTTKCTEYYSRKKIIISDSGNLYEKIYEENDKRDELLTNHLRYCPAKVKGDKIVPYEPAEE